MPFSKAFLWLPTYLFIRFAFSSKRSDGLSVLSSNPATVDMLFPRSKFSIKSRISGESPNRSTRRVPSGPGSSTYATLRQNKTFVAANCLLHACAKTQQPGSFGEADLTSDGWINTRKSLTASTTSTSPQCRLISSNDFVFDNELLRAFNFVAIPLSFLILSPSVPPPLARRTRRDLPFPLAPSTRTPHRPARLHDPPSACKLVDPLVDLMRQQATSSRDA